MANKCLVCYEPLSGKNLYHERCCYSLFHSETAPSVDFGADDIEKLALSIVNKKLALTGVQRKLSLSQNISDTGVKRLTIVGFESDYILKPPSLEFPEVPELEDLTMKLGEIYGLETARHGLIRMKDGRLAYITRRFDRVGKRKIPVEDFCQISLKMTDEKYKGSSELIAKEIRGRCTNFGEDLVKLLDLLLFCFVTGNSDMHLKNFSLMSIKGQVKFSPFYDLLSTRLLLTEKEDSEDLALPLNGKKSKLKRRDFYEFSKRIGISDAVFERSLERLQNSVKIFHECIDRSFISEKKKVEFHNLINMRMKRIHP